MDASTGQEFVYTDAIFKARARTDNKIILRREWTVFYALRPLRAGLVFTYGVADESHRRLASYLWGSAQELQLDFAVSTM